jgi:hypothetical protein
MGVPENHPAILAAIQRGLIPVERPKEKAATKRKPQLVAASFARTAAGPVWVIPIEICSLANERQWRTRNRVAQAHRKAVSGSLGRSLYDLAPLAAHYHRGGAVRVLLTRLGGRALDRTANLPAALKYVEDAVALMMGADDGDARWRCECGQEPGGPSGVRIEITEAA